MMSTKLAEELDILDKLALQAQIKNDLDGAMQCYQKILELAPGSALSYMNMATIAVLQGNYDGAITCDEIALKLQPNTPQIHNHLGIAYQKAGRIPEALAHFESALTLTPEDPFTICNFAGLCTEDYATARELFYRVFKPLVQQFDEKEAAEPLFFSEIQANALVCYVNICLNACAWGLAEPLYPILAVITKDQLTDNYQPAITPALAMLIFKDLDFVLTIARSYASARTIDSVKKFVTFNEPVGQVHIAYLYNGLDSYIYDQALLALIKQHDKNKFKVSIIHTKALAHAVVQDLKDSTINLIDVEHLSFYFGAKKIHEQSVHVLLDTMGLQQDAKPEMLHFNPAPVQVNFLAHCGTMGCGESVQFVIADDQLIPESEYKYYAESIVKLPSAMAFPKLSVQDSLKRADFGLPNHKVVFANFSPALMVSPQIFEAWMRILLQVPNSVLWLNDASEFLQHALVAKAEQYGMDTARLFFSKYNPSEEVFIHQLCDIYLDTALANSENNILSALYHIKPVVALCGDTPVSRIANSILSAAGLHENIATDLDEYVRFAANLANDKKSYKAVVVKITKALQESELFDQSIYRLNLEQAFVDILSHKKNNIS